MSRLIFSNIVHVFLLGIIGVTNDSTVVSLLNNFTGLLRRKFNAVDNVFMIVDHRDDIILLIYSSSVIEISYNFFHVPNDDSLIF